jgi:hypothetical protein
MSRFWLVVGLVGLAAGAIACGPTKLKPLPQNPPRIPDSVPERAAATRYASPQQLHLEAEDHFWGIEEDKELKRDEKREKEEQAAKLRQQEQRSGESLIPKPRTNADAGVVPDKLQ